VGQRTVVEGEGCGGKIGDLKRGAGKKRAHLRFPPFVDGLRTFLGLLPEQAGAESLPDGGKSHGLLVQGLLPFFSTRLASCRINLCRGRCPGNLFVAGEEI
jgi:hypothetical protein